MAHRPQGEPDVLSGSYDGARCIGVNLWMVFSEYVCTRGVIYNAPCCHSDHSSLLSSCLHSDVVKSSSSFVVCEV